MPVLRLPPLWSWVGRQFLVVARKAAPAGAAAGPT